MRSIVRISTLISCLILSGFDAFAQNPVAPAGQFCLFTEGNATVKASHSQGAVAIGGDLNLNGSWGTTNNTNGNFLVGGVKIGLLVNGKVNFNSGILQVNSNAYVKIGNQNGAHAWYLNSNMNNWDNIRVTPGTSYNAGSYIHVNSHVPTLGVDTNTNKVFQGGLIDFTTAFNTMRANRLTMAGWSDNTIVTNANGTPYANHNAMSGHVKLALQDQINVLNINGSTLNSFTTFDYNGIAPSATKVLVINVDAPGAFTWNVCSNGSFGNNDNGAYVIYNFYNCTALTIGQNSATILGTIFAPNATITKDNSSDIDGQVICTSFAHGPNGGGQFHPVYFLPSNLNLSSNIAPTITTHPAATSTGCTVTLTAAATGTPTPTVQWKKYNTNSSIWEAISNATNNTYAPTTSGQYQAVYTNVAGTATTNTATVTINPSVVITTHPSSLLICPSTGTTDFNSGATGYTSVQWQTNTGSGWADISGNTSATTPTLTLATTPSSLQGHRFRAKYTGACGVVYTDSATLNLHITPTIAANPSNVTTSLGSNISFTSAAFGSPTPTVQWYHRVNGFWMPVFTASATTSTLQINNVTMADTGDYRAEYVNMCATAITNPAKLILGNPPTVTTDINNQTVCNGAPVTFTAAATGTPAPTVQWQKYNTTTSSWDDISGETNTSYNFTAALANNGAQYRAKFTNIHGSVYTSERTLTVNANVIPAVGISANPSGTICSNVPVTFTAAPTNGGSSPSYQWKLNGNNVGTNSATYTASGFATGDEVSVVMTSNATCASPLTATPVAPITMTTNPVAAQPGAFTASAGTVYWGQVNVTYTVPSISGVTYNWSYSGTGLSISGTGNSISINVAQGATSGTLSVTATNACGTSTARTININVLPYITWLCTTGTSWNDPANWDGGFVPYSTINVLIPASASCEPELPSTFEVRDITVEPGAEVNIPDGEELIVNGDIKNNGTICEGVVVLNGSVAQLISGQGIICNLELDNPNGGSINTGDSVKIRETYIPNEGTLTTNGGLVLLSDSTHGTATIQAPVNGNCFNYISGNVVANKWVHGGRRAFRFLAHPFTHAIGLNQLTDDFDITGDGGSANGFTSTNTNNPSAFWYNTLTGNGSNVNDSTGWKAYTHTNGIDTNAWDPMQGARILIRGSLGQGVGCTPCIPAAVTYDMTGTVNMCDVTVNLQTNANAGYNFVGNPYAANIDMSQLTRGSAVGENFSVWDPNMGVYGAYVTQPFANPYVLSAYSSFIVTSTSNANNTILFQESAKTPNEASGNLFKTTGSSFGANSLQLKITSNNDSVNWDRLLVFFNNSASTAFETKDARKLANVSLDFYTKASDNSDLAIDFRPMADGDVIPLGLRADTLQTYAIHVADYEAPAGIQLYLKDKFLNAIQPMSQGMKYSFDVNSNPLSQGENRFEIVAAATTSVGNTPSVSGIEVAMTPNPAKDQVTISLGGVKGISQITMTSLMGQTMYTNTVTGTGSVTVPVQEMANGVYIVTVKNGNNTVTHKLVKQ